MLIYSPDYGYYGLKVDTGGTFSMKNQVLIKDAEKYRGKYVAKKSFQHKSVISVGDDPVTVHGKAKEKGVDEPVIFYVPEKESIHIY